MRHEEYPSIYIAADRASNEAQSALLRNFKANAFLLITASITSLISSTNKWFAIFSTIFFVGSLICYAYGEHKNFQGKWYQARALAESIKTATWRLMMSADPFSYSTSNENLEQFRNLLTELLQQNKSLGADLSGVDIHQEQITEGMNRLMGMAYLEKKAKYLSSRIEEQQTWYTTKAQENKNESTRLFWVLSGAYASAIFLLLIRIAYPETKYLPIEICAVIASSIIGWSKLKRFNELASAYSLTAHEIGIAKSRYQAVTTSDELSKFVADAENAYSREHTQWAARRDH